MPYKPPKTTTGDLRTPTFFYSYAPTDGPEPDEVQREQKHFCFCEMYAPSTKDLEILKSFNTKQAATIKIRDPLIDYYPSNKDFVIVDDYRFAGIVWNIIDVRPDPKKNDFIVIVLGVVK